VGDAASDYGLTGIDLDDEKIDDDDDDDNERKGEKENIHKSKKKAKPSQENSDIFHLEK
jgi:hypothetical protein